MRIGELARRAGVTPSTIRYYESIGVLPAPERMPSGYRDYDDGVVERLTFVRTAQRLGISLDEISEILAIRERDEAPCGYVRQVIHQQLGDVDRRIAELQHLRTSLTEIAAEADRLPPAPAGEGVCRLLEHGRAST